MAVEWHGDKFAQEVRTNTMAAVVKTTEAIRELAIKKIQEPPKTGHIYRHRGVEHQASAPGEAPASDTGTLVQRTTTEYDVDKLMGTVWFRTEYAAALEFGTQTVQPRPYARVSLEEKRGEFTGNISAALSKSDFIGFLRGRKA